MSERDRGEELLPDGVPGFDDPAYDDLRGLLAGARVTEPVPAEVAARLDAALADLRGEETVVPLAPRRRRTGARLLSAAAVVLAVVGGGFGLSKVVEPGGGAGGDKAASGAAESQADNDTGNGTDSGGINRSSGGAAVSVPRVRKAAFAADAARVLAKPPQTLTDLRDSLAEAPTVPNAQPSAPTPTAPEKTTDDRSPSKSTTAPLSGYAAASQSAACTAPGDAGTTAYPILFDGAPATLVVHPASAGQRLVQAWSCDGTTVLASTAVPD